MEPFPGNALELSEQMQLGRFTGITEFVHQQMLRQVHEYRIFSNLLQVLKAQVYLFADNARVLRNGSSNHLRRQRKT